MPHTKRTAPDVAIRDGGNVLAFDGRWNHPLSSQYRPAVQAPLFTAVPASRFFQVKAIAHSGESVRLGLFQHRREALQAARLMADIAGGRWCP